MKNLVIAKRYAKALFNLALDGGWVGQYGRELDDFVRLLKDFPELAEAIQNPLYPETTRKELFFAVADKADTSPILRSFISLLIEKKRVQHLDEIAEYYHRLIDEHSNVARAQIKAATELDDDIIQDISHTLENMTGKRIVVEFQQDPSLIGGVVAQIGDLVLDGSVKRQLLNFKESLKRGVLA
ncbi:MAG: ATP synthase F1 subunit delta [Syntrophobacteraceae bacterium]|nr:ATP synthase F1 subunit delta [Desulfobacteraceae bacterium]